MTLGVTVQSILEAQSEEDLRVMLRTAKKRFREALDELFISRSEIDQLREALASVAEHEPVAQPPERTT